MIMNGFLSKKRNVVFVAILYSFLWGCAFPLVKLCMDEFEVYDNMSKCLVAGIRFTLSGMIIAVISFLNDKSFFEYKKKIILPVVLYGVCTALQYTFTYIGLSNVDGSVGAVFDQMCVFIVIIVSCLFFKNDKFSLKKALGCILGFAGIVAINSEGIEFSFSFNGEGMMTFAACVQAMAYFVAVLNSNKLSMVKLVCFGQLIGGVLMIIFSYYSGGHISQITFNGVMIVFSLAIISSVAYILSLLPLKYFPASEISVFNLMITFFGVVMSAIVLGEDVFRLNYFISLVLVSMGIIMVNMKNEKKEGKNNGIYQ